MTTVVYLPVRHHSPACAIQVRRRLEELRPAEVLIEGPADFNPSFARLHEPDVVPPVALFTYVARPRDDDPDLMERAQGWYPFCDYTPEWVAIKTAARLGAAASFIDLSLKDRVELNLDAEMRERLREGGVDLFARSDEAVERYITRLGARIRARDSDETWDRLFEVGAAMEPEAFFENVRAFGAALREMTGDEVTAARGDLERERFMAAHIKEAVARCGDEATIAVVCGAFHVAGVEEALGRTESGPTRTASLAARDHGIYLVQYDFTRMARLHYAAGVAAPAWYQGLWQALDKPASTAKNGPFWMRMLSEASQVARKADAAVSTADLQAASEMALRLANFRGQLEPSRVDVLDAVRTCWVKGPMDQAHARVLGVVETVFRGDRAGRAGRSAMDPPLVQDVDALVEAASLESKTGRREVRLRPMRGERDRERMQLLLRLQYLGIEYGAQTRGPRFLDGKDLDRIEQVWSVGWNTTSRSRLLECSSYGPTLEDAVVARLKERAARTNADVRQGAAAVVRHLVDACALGLHRIADLLLAELAPVIGADSRLLSVLKAVHGLVTLYRYRDVLGGVGLPALGAAIGRCWLRALWLIDSLSTLPEAEEDEAVEGLRALEHTALTLGRQAGQPETQQQDFGVEPEDFFEALERVRPSLCHLPGLRGGAGGLLWRAGRSDAQELSDQATSHFREVGLHPEAPGRFLGGLLTVARRAVLDDPQIVEGLGGPLRALDEEDFRQSLPRLRRAVSTLTPAETGRLARLVVELWGGDAHELTSRMDAPPEMLNALHELESRVREELAGWGIASPVASTRLDLENQALEREDSNDGPTEPAPHDPELLRRWRLILGRYAEGAGMPCLGGDDAVLDDVVSFLYDREYSEDGRDQWDGAGGPVGDEDGEDGEPDDGPSSGDGGRLGGKGPSTMTVPDWINHLRELFPRETCEKLESEALSRYGMTELVTRAEVLERCEPSPALLEAILRLKHHMDPQVMAMARRIITEIAAQMRLPLLGELEACLSGSIRRASPSRRGRAADFDAGSTIRRNLRHWDAERNVLVIEQPWFAKRVRRSSDWRVMIAVDQSGSMFSSAIHAAITAGIFFSIPDIHANLVVFDTNVVDLSDQLDDPVDTLLSVNLGGGTDIAKAVGYCTELVTHPPKTLFILITDLYEGGDPALLLARLQRLLESGVKVLVLGALDDKAEAAFDRDMARRIVALGADVGAMTPKHLVNWVGEVLR